MDFDGISAKEVASVKMGICAGRGIEGSVWPKHLAGQ